MTAQRAAGNRKGWGADSGTPIVDTNQYVINYTLTVGTADLAVGAGLLRAPLPVRSQLLGSIFATGDTEGPTGAAAIFAIVKWVAAVRSELAPAPTIADGLDRSIFTVPDGVISPIYEIGDLVAIDIDQVGSTNAGQHVVASLLFEVLA